jgi:D-alanyl-lipoteichoic acid acyltransferase DltB (MBOAT superfamily)
MLFNSVQYLIFFIVVLSLAWMFSGFLRLRIYLILLASLYFYESNNGWATVLLLGTTTVDYFVSLAMMSTKEEWKRKWLLSISVVSNLGLLSFFKYTNFFGDAFARGFAFLGWKVDWVDLHILLPVGISFYTFEALSYTIDVYRGHIRATRDFARMAFLVSFFPHLIAGPIVRAAQFFPQMDLVPRLTVPALERALLLIVCGLVKKIVLADNLAPLVDAAFSDPVSAGTVATWVGVYCFAFQIYFDFSGYSDIAIGSGLLLGYTLPENFNRPYVSQSVTEFWRRWHMSLSSWLRDYLYISLGGNRMPSRWGVYRNLIITMALGGLWHGAAWNFVIWGVLHGVWLSAEKALGIGPQKGGLSTGGGGSLLRAFVVFQGVVALWLVFRVQDVPELIRCVSVMFHWVPGPITRSMLLAVMVIVAAWVWQIVNERLDLKAIFLRLPVFMKAGLYAAASVMVLLFNTDVPKAFIYFRF